MNIDKGSSTPIRQDKQMPNMALALLDTVTGGARCHRGVR